MEESLESLQAEREQRYALKKELDTKNNSESMFQLGNLALSIQVTRFPVSTHVIVHSTQRFHIISRYQRNKKTGYTYFYFQNKVYKNAQPDFHPNFKNFLKAEIQAF